MVQFCVERVDGFVDDVVRVRGVVEEVTAVFGGWVVDEASRVVELVCDVDAVGVFGKDFLNPAQVLFVILTCVVIT